MRPTVETGNIFGFRIPVSLSVLSFEIGPKNHPILLKFDANVHILGDISCLVFNIHNASGSHRGAHKRLAIYCDLWTDFF